MTVAELKKLLNTVSEPDLTLVTIPDFSCCSCGERDGEYSPATTQFQARQDGYTKHRFKIE